MIFICEGGHFHTPVPALHSLLDSCKRVARLVIFLRALGNSLSVRAGCYRTHGDACITRVCLCSTITVYHTLKKTQQTLEKGVIGMSWGDRMNLLASLWFLPAPSVFFIVSFWFTVEFIPIVMFELGKRKLCRGDRFWLNAFDL